MLTEKELKFLNFLYKKLGGKHLDFETLSKFIENKIRLNSEKSFELAYLYDNNFEEANGDFKNVKNVKRLSYQDYFERIPNEILAVSKITKDNDFNSYEITDNDLYVTIEYKTENHYIPFIVFKSRKKLITHMSNIVADHMRDSPEEYAHDFIVDDFTHIERSMRNTIAIDAVNKWMKEHMLTNEDIASYRGENNGFDDLNKAKESLNNTLGQLINAKELMDDYLELHRLGKEEEDQDEYIKLEFQINKYIEHINAIHDKVIGGSVIKDDMTIEEITNEVDEILYEIDYQIEGIVEDEINDIRELKFEEYSSFLRNEPYRFFSENFGLDQIEYLNQNFVKINYELAADNFVETSSEEDYAMIMEFSNQDTIYIKGTKYFIFW